MAAELSDPKENEDRQIISTGNTELDKKIADGLPMGSLTLIEGENDTGKSILTQQIIWGAMRQGLSVDLFTTENTSRSFIKQMESMSLDISEYFAWGYLRVFPLHVAGFEWKKEEMEGIMARLVAHIRNSKSPVAIIDSLTLFTKYTQTDTILEFFTSCKTLEQYWFLCTYTWTRIFVLLVSPTPDWMGRKEGGISPRRSSAARNRRRFHRCARWRRQRR